MFVLHVALQGCLRGSQTPYGITADTGGHIRYLLGMVDASERLDEVDRIVIATRAFESIHGPDFAAPFERVSSVTEIVRFPTDDAGYLPKEALWRETQTFARRLIEWIRAQPRAPDIIHAHYADAGAVAAIVQNELGVPYTFVAHSLGRVKLQAFQDRSVQDRSLQRAAEPAPMPDAIETLQRRIATEELAMREAALVIASSRDEAETQYASYEAYDPGRIRVVPPGAELDTFVNARPCVKVDAAINRFLAAPDKPPLLAIARPVNRKNLAALVRAFGESPRLREMANLVLIAGRRDDYRDLEPEMAGCLQDLLHLIDRYDLYGQVAYPKSHDPDDVPAIYAYARQRRGIFVNPALNEPFGLTLLEAAAVGVPLIATESGGPNDIIEICRNGELVNPNSPAAIADVACRMLSDAKGWEAYASAGSEAVKRFDWNSHARRYHALANEIVCRTGASPRGAEMLTCDIDNTLVGSTSALACFRSWLTRQPSITFAIATGRSFHSALSVLEQEGAPAPDVMITSVGSEIYHRQADGPAYRCDKNWAAWISEGWDRAGVLAALTNIAELRLQAPLEQRRFKISYLTSGTADVRAIVAERLNALGLDCTLIWSHGRYMDILPARASKGAAVEFVARQFGLAPDAVYVAGDSGNDIDMLGRFSNAIVVANCCDGLDGLDGLKHCYFAPRAFAQGVVDGVEHFRRASERRTVTAAAAPLHDLEREVAACFMRS